MSNIVSNVTAFCSAPALELKNASSNRIGSERWRMCKRSPKPMTRRETFTAIGRTLMASVTAGFFERLERSLPSNAAMYSKDVDGSSFAPKGDPEKLETYMPQIRAGYQALVDLESNWVAQTRDYDGDKIRRVLGSVGVTSPLFNIRKSFVNAWKIAANSPQLEQEIVEEMDTDWNLVLDGISSIDYQCYSVTFTELESTKDSLFEQAKAGLHDTIGHYKTFVDNLEKIL